MKTLKTAHIGIAVIGLLLFFSCSSTAKISENNPPFKVLKATYSNWKGSKPSENGFLITIKTNNSAVVLDTVFFRNTITPLIFNKEPETYSATIVVPNSKLDLQLDINSKNEFGNQVPHTSTKIPFDLKENEAVVSYLYKGKNYFHKISNVIKVSLN
ncbi:hypothetical protein ACFQ5N_03760 [Lutibacter holmesii]|uniref:Lipoprotein n=1 Tax=Lutibacter holmesii TaxID=1137985 RepID=A0ABW3WNS8_9FLAO